MNVTMLFAEPQGDTPPMAPVILTDKKGNEHELPAASCALADTHGHLMHLRSRSAIDVLSRALLAGVRLLVVPLDPTDEAANAEDVLSWLDEQAAAVPELDVRLLGGAHPYGAAKLLAGEGRDALDALLASPRCVGVGEIGLDFGPWNELPLDVQEEAFKLQLRIARERALPVELHLRDPEKGEPIAHIEAARILREEGVPEAGCVLHCFTSGPEVMAPFVDMGCYIAFGGAVTFPRSEDIRAAAADCPTELILSETDSPYMAPVPFRGSKCETAMVACSAACVARVREEAGVAPAENTYRALWDNACRLFSSR